MDFQQQLDSIREASRSKLQSAKTEVIESAFALLSEDLRNPALNDLGKVGPDTFMLRAHYTGLALFDSGLYSLAEAFYDHLAKQTEQYCRESGESRHTGALYVNKAVACFAQGNVDQGIIDILKAAQDDIKIYSIATIRDSYAIQTLLPYYFGNRVQEAALTIIQKVNPQLTLRDVQDLCRELGNNQFIRDYVLLAYIELALRHIETNRRTPNEFSQLQVFSTLRSVSAMFEIQLKSMNKGGNPKDTLYPTLKSLYSCKGWWDDNTGARQVFEQTRQNIGATEKSTKPIDEVLKDALSITPTDDDSKFWKSLLVAYVVRNYTVHQLETQCALIQSYPEEALGHILNALISAPKFV